MSQEVTKGDLNQEEKNKIIQSGKRGIFHMVFSRTMIILLTLLLQLVLYFLTMFSIVEHVAVWFGSIAILTAVMLFYILNTQENPSIKLSWCIVIAVLPLFGIVLYFFVRYDLGYRLEQKVLEKSMKESDAFVPGQEALWEQIKVEDKALYNVARYLRSNGQHTIYTNTEVKYFPVGEDMFAEMLAQLEQAKEFIFLEYFAIGPSYMWSTVLELLVRKAKTGVDVRVMYDGSNAVTTLPYNYPKQLKELGIQCKVFSEFHPFVSTHYNNRDHRKILVIDGRVAFTGGVNLQDRYINRKEVFGHWKDTGVMLAGDGAQGFTLLFLQMWNALEKERVYEPYMIPVGQAHETCAEAGYVIPYSDTPMDTENVGEMVYLDMLNRAKDYAYIMTPYLILDHEMITAITFAAKRGVDVRLILPHIPDKKYAFILARSHYKELVSAGVKIYEYTPGFVHAKEFLCDDKEAVVGTINLDYRSLYLHFECAAYLYKVPALQDIRRDFEETMEKSQLITMEEVKKLPWYVRVNGRILKVIAPLM